MLIIVNFLMLLFLFGILGKAADLAVRNIKYIASVLKVRLFVFGILLGLITTLPELSLGLNTIVNRAGAISVGNLLGGIIVILCFILGINLLLNRKIETDGRLAFLIPVVLLMLTPIFLGLDGRYGVFDGLVMIAFYVGLIFHLHRLNHFSNNSYVGIANKNKIAKSIFLSIFYVILIVVASHWIVEITLKLLEYMEISQMIVGFTVFALGTNLPEISIAFTSWRKKTSELSLSHLISSAFTNVLVLGILAVINPIFFNVDYSYYVVAIFLILTLALFFWFYYSGKKMDRKEGIMLLIVYFMFILANVCFIFLS